MAQITHTITPREKLIRQGPEQLSAVELLVLLLGGGVKRKNTVRVAHDVNTCLSSTKHIGVEELSSIAGMGNNKAVTVLAALELGKRLYGSKKTKLIAKPGDIWLLMRDEAAKKKEYFVVFYLNMRSQMIQKEVISIGSLSASIAHPREVFEPAVRHHAGQIILAHNHPSGDCSPSHEDRETTKRLVKAGEILGIEVLDHVVVTNESYISMKEKRMM